MENSGQNLLSFATFFLLCFVTPLFAAKQLNCGVCKVFLQRVVDATPSADMSDPEKIENVLIEQCEKTHETKEQRFCSFIGTTRNSPTRIVNFVTKPLAYYKPVKDVCEALGQKDRDICLLEYDEEIDVKTVDLNKLKVPALKKILSKWNEECKGCSEKSDFVRRIKELMPKHVKTDL